MDRESLINLRVVDLKEMLRSKGEKVSGRKDDLVERLLLSNKKEKREREEGEDEIIINNQPINKLPKELLILIALELETPELFSFCLASKRFNESTCNNPDFWRIKLSKAPFPDKVKDVSRLNNPKDYYRIQLEKFKDYLNAKLIEFASAGDINKVKRAVELGANINYTGWVDHDIVAPIEIAAKNGHLDIVKYLISLNLLAKTQKNKYHFDSALIKALQNHHYDVARYLIAHGADLNFDDGWALDLIHMSGDKDLIKYVKSIHR